MRLNVKKLFSVKEKVSQAYEAFQRDPFIVRQDLHHIFLIPLQQSLTQDADGLQCFLSTYNIAIAEQSLSIGETSRNCSNLFLSSLFTSDSSVG